MPFTSSHTFSQSFRVILLSLFSLLLALPEVEASAPLTVRLDAKNFSGDSLIFSNGIEAFSTINRLADKGVSNIRLEVAPGVYWLDDPDDPAVREMPDNSIPYAVTLRCDTLSIVATDGNPANTIFAVNRGQTRGAIGNFTMLHFFGKEFNVSNLTFGNYCNTDLIYPPDSTLNRPRRSTPIVQAQIGICEGTDRLFASNCRFISRLNLCPLVGSRRSLYKNCYFECTDDALTGSAVYLDCRFSFFSSKPFYNTPLTGAVFLNCDIELRGKSPQYLTKIPGAVTLIDTRFSLSGPSRDMTVSWTRDKAPVVCYYSNVTLDGKSVAIDASRPEMSVDLTATRALEAFKVVCENNTLYNTPNLLAGDDGWDPLNQLPAIRRAELLLGRPLLDLPVTIRISPSSVHLASVGDTATITPCLLRWGGYEITPAQFSRLSPISINYTAKSVLILSSLPQWGCVTATDNNHLPITVDGLLTASTDFGLQGAASYSLAPALKEAPVFATSPSLQPGKGLYKVNYSLGEASDDATLFEWFSTADTNLTDTIPLCYGRGSAFSQFPLSLAETGRYICVRITPQASDSKSGIPQLLISDRPVELRQLSRHERKPQSVYATDFSDVPVRFRNCRAPGTWSFDSFKPADTEQYAWLPDTIHSWYYGRATDAATGIGLVQWTRGARAFYTPRRDSCRNMTASLILQPCKSAGQGFGSATGQYLDLYLKYDPATLSGYGVRIERTVDYDHAVVFTLMHFDHGKAIPISPSVASSCFRTPCMIDMAIHNGLFTLHASTEAEAETDTPSDPGSPQPEVNLSAVIPDSAGSALFGLQHTGTTGAGATLISNVSLTWQ